MRAGKKPKETIRKKSRARRIIRWSLLGVLLLLVVVFLVAPAVVSSGGFRKYLLAKINENVDGRTDFSDLSMGWLKGVRVEDLSFDDSAGQLSVKVKEIHTKPHYAKLIGGNLSFGTTTIDQPRVEIRLKDETSAVKPPAPQPSPVPVEAAGIAVVTDVVVTDGSVRVTDASARTAELSNINSKIALRRPGKTSTLELETTVVAKAGESRIQASAEVTPAKPKKGKGWTLEGATGSLTVTVKDLDLESIEPLLALSGTEIKSKGKLSADLKSEIKDGKLANVAGKINGSGLDVAAPQLKGDRFQTKVLDADIKVTAKDKAINIDSLKLKTDWAALNLSGSVPTELAGADKMKPLWESELKGDFDCDLPAVAALMPNTLGLKEGTNITSGKVSGDIQTVTEGAKKQIRANADLAGLKGTVSGKAVALSQPVEARVLLSEDKDTVKFDQVAVTSSFANIKASGTMENIRCDADMDLAKLQAELGQFVDLGGYKLSGRAVETGQITIEPNYIGVVGTAQMTDVSITSPNNVTASEPKAMFNFDIGLDQKQNVLALDAVKADTSFGKVDIKDGVVPLGEDAKKAMKLAVNAGGVDLGKLRPFAIVFGSLGEDTLLGGIAESQIDITSEKDTYRISTKNTKIKNIEYGFVGKKPFRQSEVSLVGDALLNSAEKQYVVKAKLLSDAVVADLELANVTKEGQSLLKGKANLAYDAAVLGDAVSGYTASDIKLAGKRATSVEFDSRYPADDSGKLLANLSTNKCTLGFDKIDYRGLNMGVTDVNAQFDKGLLKIDPFTTTANSGQIKLGADVDFREASPVVSIPQPIWLKGININEKLSHEFKDKLAVLNPVFKDNIGVGGTFNFNAQKLYMPLAPERKKDIQMVASLSMENVNFTSTGLLGQLLGPLGLGGRNTVATVHPTPFTVKDGLLKYDDAMQIDVLRHPLIFKGGVDLVKGEYKDMTVDLSLGEDLKMLGLGEGTITGSIDNPQISFAKKPEELIENTLKNLLKKEGLDGLFNR